MSSDKKSGIPFLLPIRSIVFVAVFIVGSIIVGKDLSEISNWWSVLATIVNILTFLLLIGIAKNKGQTYLELINYEKGKTKVSQVILISIIVLMIGTGGMYLAGFIFYGKIPYSPPMMIEPIPKVLAIVNMLLLPVTTALAEDGLYLGYGVNRLKNKYASIFVPAFFYALQHSFIPTLFDGKFILYRFFSFLPLTIILCWNYNKKRNPLPIMIGHALIDMASASMILATSLVPGLYERWCCMNL
jgi:membrane protease YdiL (CAAX protease family)